ncbi:hypothetical protein GKN89_20250 [Serratia sp. YC16]|uniref:hypothetical protein n=1 Tax=Serratia TaxID=613 RepID=UPI0012B7C44E|nr:MULTISPECIES: hypothetical protein [Serratia]MBI6154885.1 hypothetical protein [Serratia surfactantfaciens]MTD09059.1 hypothetical protein [Serratia sp. YC16]
MYKNRKRALRRYHYRRLRSDRKNYYGGIRYPEQFTLHGIARRAGKLVASAPDCSCWMCGNPRRYWQSVTLQELKARDSEGDGWAEFDAESV